MSESEETIEFEEDSVDDSQKIEVNFDFRYPDAIPISEDGLFEVIGFVVRDALKVSCVLLLPDWNVDLVNFREDCTQYLNSNDFKLIMKAQLMNALKGMNDQNHGVGYRRLLEKDNFVKSVVNSLKVTVLDSVED